MGTKSDAAARADLDRIAETRLDIKELTDAGTLRHRMQRGTPEYVAALETEGYLAARVWRRLRSDSQRAASRKT
jgi:hypothetical protein